MKQIIVKTQEEFDKIRRVERDEEVIFENSKIRISANMEIFGILRLKGEIDSEWGRHLIGWGASQIHNVGWGSSQIHNEGWGSSQIHNVGRESSQIHNVGRGSSQIHNVGTCSSLTLFNFSVASIPFNLKLKIKKSKSAMVQKYKPITDWFDRNGIQKTANVILYKKVSKDFKTQEGTPNENLWVI